MVGWGLFLCLCSTLCGIPALDATIVWTDSFSDGDYNGWTVQVGGFAASSNRLQSTGALDNAISRSSIVATGTWNFTVNWVNIATTGGGWIYFVAYDLNPAINNYPDEGYCIVVGSGGWGLARWENGGQNIMDGYTDGPYDGTYDVYITRNATGNIRVYIDNVLRMERQNTVHSTSTHFFYRVLDAGQWIDNIVVNDEPPSNGENGNGGMLLPIPVEVIAIAGGLVAVIVIVAVVVLVLRRRRSGP